MNETLKVMAERFACRSFTGQMPDDEALQAVANAAIQSPSGLNRQPWRIIMVKNAALLAELEQAGLDVLAAMDDQSHWQRIQARGGKLFYNAPCIFYITVETAALPDAAVDCGIVCQSVAIATKSLGLDSCICGMAALPLGGEKGDYFRQRLGFAPGHGFGAAVLVGMAAAPGRPHTPDETKVYIVD